MQDSGAFPVFIYLLLVDSYFMSDDIASITSQKITNLTTRDLTQGSTIQKITELHAKKQSLLDDDGEYLYVSD